MQHEHIMSRKRYDVPGPVLASSAMMILLRKLPNVVAPTKIRKFANFANSQNREFHRKLCKLCKFAEPAIRRSHLFAIFNHLKQVLMMRYMSESWTLKLLVSHHVRMWITRACYYLLYIVHAVAAATAGIRFKQQTGVPTAAVRVVRLLDTGILLRSVCGANKRPNATKYRPMRHTERALVRETAAGELQT